MSEKNYLIPDLPPMTETVITDFIRRKVEESGVNGVVIGLSGGIDSALVAALCRMAIGEKKVKALIMPAPGSSPEDREIAQRFAEELGIEYSVIDIASTVNALESMLIPEGGEGTRTAAGNIRARVRMIVLFHTAAVEKRVVMGTSNKSELLTGYFTKFGDGGADFSPIGDLYKTQVRELGRALGLPDYILKRRPSAGLWAGQTDEGELGMDYRTLDTVLYGIETLKTCKKISEETGIPIEQVRKVEEMVKRSVHKRKMPLIPKVGLRTIGLDWRE